MNDELKEHLAALAEKLGVTVRYEMALMADSLDTSWPGINERYSVSTAKHKPIYRVTIKQIMALTADDFVRDGHD